MDPLIRIFNVWQFLKFTNCSPVGHYVVLDMLDGRMMSLREYIELGRGKHKGKVAGDHAF